MKKSPHKKAFALVLVLITIVLAAAMAVFFLSSAGRERRGVDMYARSSEVRHLAGMTVNKVMGQIGTATKEGTAAEPVSWASQPGMVRTYGGDGNPKNIYKLYSWDNLLTPGAGYDPSAATELPPAGWNTEVATYTDLNQPISDVYPIMDPRAVAPVVPGFAIDKTDVAVKDSGSDAPMPVKWLYVLRDGQMVAPSSGNGKTATVPGASATNPITGRVAFWTDDETSKVNINTASEGAFWDLPKSGSYEDMQFIANPPTKGEYQRVAGHPSMTSLSAVLPELKTKEFYRWSVTDRDAYRKELEDLYGMVPRINWGGSKGGTFPAEETGYKMALPFPLTWTDTHKAATTIYPDADRLYTTADDLWFAPNRTTNAPLSSNLTPAEFQQRLFFLTANSRAPETTLFETPRISLWPITWPYSNSAHAKRNATYRAPVPASLQDPDSTPLNQDVWMTAEERLLAFCATLNYQAPTENRYFFQRQNPESPSQDWTNIERNQKMVNYVRTMMEKPEPGFGGSLAPQLGEASSDWLALNTFDYARSLINQATAPDMKRGIVYSFTGVASRWGNLTNGPLGTKTAGLNTTNETNAFATSPLRIDLKGNEYTTLGSFPRLEEVVVMFYATDRLEPKIRTVAEAYPQPVGIVPLSNEDAKTPYAWTNLINLDPSNRESVVVNKGPDGVENTSDDFHGYDNGTPGDPTDDFGARTIEMRAVMLFDFANMMPGIDFFGPTFWIKVRGGSFLASDPDSAGLPAPIDFPKSAGRSAKIDFSNRVTAPYVIWPLFSKSTSRPKWFNNEPTSGDEHLYWPFISDPIKVDPYKSTFDFTGSKVTVEFYACYPTNTDQDPTGDANQLIEEKVIDFTSWSRALPIPIAPRWSTMSQLYAAPAGGFPPKNPSNGKYLRPSPGATAVQATFPPATLPARSEQRDTRWAWADFAPALVDYYNPNTTAQKTKALNSYAPNTTLLPDKASLKPTYLYRVGVIKEYNDLSSSRDVHDVADRSPERTPWPNSALTEEPDPLPNDLFDLRLSTNLRKRVDACNQRNGAAQRGVYFHEGTNASSLVAPPVGEEWRGWTGGPDAFMATTDAAMMTAFPLVTVYDTAISMIADPGDKGDGDPRLASFSKYKRIDDVITKVKPALILPSVDQGPGTKYFARPTADNLEGKQFHHLGTPGMSALATGYKMEPALNDGTRFAYRVGEIDTHYQGEDSGADFPANMVLPDKSDWTTTPGIFREGGLLARPDQDYQWFVKDTSGDTRTPYYNNYQNSYTDKSGAANPSEVSLFSPNRQIPSPITILGTMPRSTETGWQTLAFNPYPADPDHPGLGSSANQAPDHLYLDLFWMPVCEPYPISDQLSTAGKINLNYRIQPFPYIERTTGLRALMKSTWTFGLPNDTIGFYETAGMRGVVASIDNLKLGGKTGVWTTRYPVNLPETLTFFDKVFDKGDLFRSASQITQVPLVPDDGATTASTIGAYWSARSDTADNAREQPYDHLYSRVTTKSNTYTVHWRAQVLRKSPSTAPDAWDEAKDRMAAELRGSTLIERYIDPNATNIPDYATKADAEPLSAFYKWRVVSENYFQP